MLDDRLANKQSYVQLWINDLKVGSNLSPDGDHIKASSDYVAFVHGKDKLIYVKDGV